MIVGTAGHVDHGKTTLVRALTGIDTDRLKEEKARGITIDLGFAYMPGPDDEPIGFVDVPGHERLVRTMVAGATGIDFALIVIAGDDGIMPQTREHLEILELLGLTRGLIAITKCDRIDTARRAAVAREIIAATSSTPFAAVAPLFVSAATGEGVDDLRQRLTDAAMTSSQQSREGQFRLPIDRAFNLVGIGTVVTGTALCGRVTVGDDVTVMPSRNRARVRSLHAQNHEVTAGVAGNRCALALVGIGLSKEIVGRGTWVCGGSDVVGETLRFDADLRLLAGETKPLRDWTPVHFHCGASDVTARVVVLADDGLPPGQRAPAQIVLAQALPLRHGDRFVLRDQNGQRTIGGGTVLDPRAPLRKRRTLERMARLDALRPSDPASALTRLLDLAPGFEDLGAFAADRGLTPQQTDAVRAQLGLMTLRVGASTFVHTSAQWDRLARDVIARLAAFHAEHPELPGLAGERLRLLTYALPKPLFAAVRDRLAAEKRIAVQGHWVRLPNHVAELGVEESRIATLAKPLIAYERFRPPRVRDIGAEISQGEASVRRTCKALVRIGELIEVAQDHFFLRETVVEMANIANDLTRTSATGVFAAADFRDKLGNGRKVAIQILEYFDHQGLTHRNGDLRRVVKAPELIFGPRLEVA